MKKKAGKLVINSIKEKLKEKGFLKNISNLAPKA